MVSPSFASVLAQAPTLLDVGVDVEGWMPVVVSNLGTTLVAALGAFFALLLIRVGLRWLASYVK